MTTEVERARGGMVIASESGALYIIPKDKLDQFKHTGDDIEELINSLVATGRLFNIKAARQIDEQPRDDDLGVSLFGGAFP